MRSRLFSTVAGPKYSTRDGRSSIGGRAHFQSDENHPDAVFSSNGKRIGFQINLRSARDNVIDEENGISRSTLATGLESYRSKRVAPEKFRDYRDGAEQTLQVIQTKHISEEEGQDTVILTVTENVKANIGEDTSCDIRWIHIDHNAMDFTAFQAYALNAPGLLNDDKALILRLLKKVRTTSERRWVHGRYLEPVAMRYSGKDPNHDAESKTATFRCLPYFSLGPYNSSNYTRDSFVHPVRTLLQSRYHLEATERRDKLQVVRKLDRPEHDGILHVPQFWCLVINKNLIITCAPMDVKKLHGPSIHTTPYYKSTTSEGPASVRFTDLEGRLYFLPLEQCRTWFELIEKVLQVCPDYEGASLGQLSYQYSFVNQNGQQITDKNWRRFLDAEKSAFVYLYLQCNGSSDDEPSDFTSESESDAVSFQLLETKPKKPQRKYENGAEVPSILIREGRAVTFQDSPHIIPPRFPSDPASPAFLAENLRGRKASPDRFYHKSHNWDHSQHQPLRLSRSLENNSLLPKRNLSPDNLLISQSPKVAKVNWESVNWEQVRPRRKRTEDEEPHGHRDPKVRRVPTLDRCVEGKHTTHHHHHGTLRKQSEPSRRRHSYRLSRQIHEEITDIYWVPPSRRSSIGPSMSISETSPSILEAKFNDENAASSELSAETDMKENQANSTDVKVKKSKRSTKLPSRSVSPNPQNTSVLPIFTWPTVDLEYIPNKALPLQRFTTQTNLAVPESQSFVNTPQSVQMDDQTLAVVLADAHDRLSNRKGKGYRDLYQAAVENTIQDVEAVIEQLGKGGIGGTNNGKDDEEAYQRSKLIENRDKKQLLDLAKRLCDAFIPANYRCTVTKKYWGAIHSILSTKQTPPKHRSRNTDLKYIIEAASEYLELLEEIQAGVYAGTDPRNLQYRIPQSLVKAFQQIVMFFIYSSALIEPISSNGLHPSHLHNLRDECKGQCRDLLVEGKYELILMIHTNDYTNGAGYEAVTTEALMALVMEGLLNESSRDGTFDLTEIYGEYLLKLEGQAQEHPSVRVFEDIKYLSEELEIIGKTLTSQRLVLEDCWKLSNMDAVSGLPSEQISNNIIKRCMENIDQREAEFEELLIQALNTQFLAAQSISLKAESNNKAILIFTIVTIIFLPLSFVASLLGMNTVDIRTTTYGQGLFWSIALPLTFVILAAAVLVAYHKPWMGYYRAAEALRLKESKKLQ